MTPAEVLGLKALALMKDKSFAIFIICSFLLCIPLSFLLPVCQWFPKRNGSGEFSAYSGTGFSEIFFLLLVPWFFRKLGVKKMLLIGMAFWVLRYVLFAQATPEAHILLYLGVLFHGICYDFFFVTGQLYVDKAAPDDIRSSAQVLLLLLLLAQECLWVESSTVGGTLSKQSKGF